MQNFITVMDAVSGIHTVVSVSLTSTLIWCSPHESDENGNRSMQWLVAEHKNSLRIKGCKKWSCEEIYTNYICKGCLSIHVLLSYGFWYLSWQTEREIEIPTDCNSYAFRVTPFLKCNFQIDYLDSWLWKATDIIFEKNATQIMHPRESIFRSDWHC